jgi:hypothetical protein
METELRACHLRNRSSTARDARHFSLLTIHMFSYWRFPGAQSPEVMWQELGTDHSYSSSAEIRNEWISTSTKPRAFICCTGTATLILHPSVIAFLQFNSDFHLRFTGYSFQSCCQFIQSSKFSYHWDYLESRFLVGY